MVISEEKQHFLLLGIASLIFIVFVAGLGESPNTPEDTTSTVFLA
ncbi:MAG TPA: hypothetical protein VIO64_09475 [Pseudobacteroides sp.]